MCGRSGDPRRGGDELPGHLDLLAPERPAEQRAELRSDLAVEQGALDRQGVDALGQVLAGRLAELLLARDDVEDVVADLEDDPEALAEAR